MALMAEWSRTDVAFVDRVHDLFGTGSGGRNGAYLLNRQTVLRGYVPDLWPGGYYSAFVRR